MDIKPKLAFLITQDWYYISHRQSLALSAKSQGYDVSLITQVDKHEQEIMASGINLIPIMFYRSLKNILHEISTIKQIYRAYNQEQPDIIHQVSLKPCLYGAIAILLGATKKSKPLVLNAFTGLGFIFTANTFFAKSLRLLIIPIFRMLFRQTNMQVVFQNESDQQTFIKYKMVQNEQCHIIPGSGVEIDRYTLSPEPEGIITVMLVARMLIEKGVYEFVAAARELKENNLPVRFVLVGDTDEENPSGIPRGQLKKWEDEGLLEWWGLQEDMPKIYQKSHIIVLPSYREGLPKVLLEAAAMGRPIVTTDVPGCRDAVIHEKTGLIIPLKSVQGLCSAIAKLITDKDLRLAFGNAGREMIEKKFSTDIINSQFLNIYQLSLDKN